MIYTPFSNSIPSGSAGGFSGSELGGLLDDSGGMEIGLLGLSEAWQPEKSRSKDKITGHFLRLIIICPFPQYKNSALGFIKEFMVRLFKFRLKLLPVQRI